MKQTHLLRKCAALIMLAALPCSLSAQEHHCKNVEKAVINNIMTRTSVRQYQDKAVEQDKVETMLRAGMAAPTAVNKQPWHFIVVNDKAILEKIAEINPNKRMLKTAPLGIIVCGNLEKALSGDAQQYWIQDTSAATENILLAAHGLGLGAVWTALFPNKNRYEPLRELLGIPEHIMPLNIIIIGYPAESPTPKDKWKPENVSYNKF
ncbi:MAG: nitroreductase family protein [Prevotella sp.]|nr:nitroreductase family protein [Prevotella sp.]